jgi:hypothetical protein
MKPNSGVRPSPIAGLWYNGDPYQLERRVDQYLEDAQIRQLSGQVVALIAPHAGHRYSGLTAGHAFKAVKGASYDLVAIVSPFHSYHPAQVITSAHTHYATPLGEIPVDHQLVQEICEEFTRETGVDVAFVREDEEHSLEIELPFLQRALTKPFKLLPFMLRSRDQRIAEGLGAALADRLKDRNALLVASSDLSHFYPQGVAAKLDGEMLAQVAAFSPAGVLTAELTGKGFACGAAAIAAVLFAARKLGANEVKLLHYSTSADETGDTSSVVGYGAAVVLKTG